jgi:hypothetical protein
MAEFLKAQTPQELWKASLKPKDPLKPDDPAKPGDATASATSPVRAATAPGIGLALDVTA